MKGVKLPDIRPESQLFTGACKYVKLCSLKSSKITLYSFHDKWGAGGNKLEGIEV
jgi:hypothetical protein